MSLLLINGEDICRAYLLSILLLVHVFIRVLLRSIRNDHVHRRPAYRHPATTNTVGLWCDICVLARPVTYIGRCTWAGSVVSHDLCRQPRPLATVPSTVSADGCRWIHVCPSMYVSSTTNSNRPCMYLSKRYQFRRAAWPLHPTQHLNHYTSTADHPAACGTRPPYVVVSTCQEPNNDLIPQPYLEHAGV